MKKKKVVDFGEFYQLDRFKEHDLRIMIDSGAFTINNNPSEWPIEKCIAFRDEYIKWLIHNKEYINLAVELDLIHALTKDELADWRDNHFAKLTRDHGINICYVWHLQDKIAGWLELCKKYDYVGLSSAGKWDTAKLASYCRLARKNKAKVHAFGFTKPTELVKMNPYSADSTAWINAMKFGTTFILDKNAFRVYDLNRKDIRNRYKRKYQTAEKTYPFIPLDWKLIKKDDPNETTKASIVEWVLLEKWINKRIKLRKEKAAIGKPDAPTGAAPGQLI